MSTRAPEHDVASHPTSRAPASPSRSAPRPHPARSTSTRAGSDRGLLLAILVAGVLTTLVAIAGIGVPATQSADAAVDEPQYLLSAVSLVEDGDLDISDERAQGTARAFHAGALPVQTAVQSDGERISPHDPLLPVLLAPAVAVAPTVGVPAWVGAKILMSLLAGAVAVAMVWLLVTRWRIHPALAGAVAVAAGASTPLAVYGHQVYPEVAAALAVLVAVGAIVPAHRAHHSAGRSEPLGASNRGLALRALVLVLAVSALPWLAAKYVLVAAALATVGLLGLARASRRLAAGAALGLTLSGVVWLAVHQVVYGGWTAYAAGDHFQSRGEFSAVGFDPDLLGRSTRWVGLLADRDYGLVAWQPAWLLAVPALGLLWGLARPLGSPLMRPPQPGANRAASPQHHLAVLVAPLVAGFVTAVYVALTMHGFWWPGRQVVVVLPLAAMLVALALAHPALPRRRAWAAGAGLLAAIGVAVHAWVLLAGHAGDLTWVGAPDVAPPAALAVLRSALPDYRALGPLTWLLHVVWALALLALLVGARHAGARLPRPEGVGR